MDVAGPAAPVSVKRGRWIKSVIGASVLWGTLFIFGTPGWAQENSNFRFSRQSFSLDYNSWFQELLIKNSSTNYVTQGLLYGIGLNYHYNTYYTKMGWGLEAGIINGFGVAGRSSSQTEYYANRVPLQVLRFGGRIFSRINSRFDLGGTLDFLLGSSGWPNNKGQTVQPQADRSIGFFLDSHWIITPNWEVIQGIGTYSRSKSTAWRLGASYTF